MAIPDYTGLSDQFREYAQALSPDVRERFIQVTQATFGIKERRNVILWITEAATRRNFINRQLGPLEIEMRQAYVFGLTNNVPPNTIQKETELPLNPQRAGYKMRQYLSEDFTRESVTSIGFLPDKILYTYNADSGAFEDIDDDASAEFENIPTDPDPEPDPENPEE